MKLPLLTALSHNELNTPVVYLNLASLIFFTYREARGVPESRLVLQQVARQASTEFQIGTRKRRCFIARQIFVRAASSACPLLDKRT